MKLPLHVCVAKYPYALSLGVQRQLAYSLTTSHMTSNEEEMNNDMGDVTLQDVEGPSLPEDDQNRPGVVDDNTSVLGEDPELAQAPPTPNLEQLPSP